MLPLGAGFRRHDDGEVIVAPTKVGAQEPDSAQPALGAGFRRHDDGEVIVAPTKVGAQGPWSALLPWIPASAGMTGREIRRSVALDAGFRRQ
jgi:hypothetical protein